MLLLAVLGFFFLPVGRKTTAEHFRDIFTTEPAREMARSFGDSVQVLAGKAVDEARIVRSRIAESGDAMKR